MNQLANPFIISGYEGEHYFCDRRQETKDITSLLLKVNNIALISLHRYEKTDLIRHCFAKDDIKKRLLFAYKTSVMYETIAINS